MSDIVTTKELHERTGKSLATIRRHAAKWGGFKMPGTRDWLFPREKVDELLRGK